MPKLKGAARGLGRILGRGVEAAPPPKRIVTWMPTPNIRIDPNPMRTKVEANVARSRAVRAARAANNPMSMGSPRVGTQAANKAVNQKVLNAGRSRGRRMGRGAAIWAGAGTAALGAGFVGANRPRGSSSMYGSSGGQM